MISTPSACIVADKEKVAKAVLMPGDPLRAKYIAENIWRIRNYSTLFVICTDIQVHIKENASLLWEAVWVFRL